MSGIVMLTEALGERLSSYRVARNLKQSELADMAGVDRTTLSRLEKGKGTIDTLIRVLLALGVEQRILEVVPDASLNPLDPMASAGRKRQRVRKSETSELPDRWSWGDDDS